MKWSLLKGLPVLVACAFLFGCGETAPPPEAEVLRPVRFIEVGEVSAAQERVFSGLSRSSEESRLSFKVEGNIVELPVKLGTSLKKGQLVAALDPSTYALRAEQSQANLLQTEASLRNAATNYERVKGLYANSNASRGDLDGARASEESARAQASASRKALEIALLNLSYTRLTATSDCEVVAVKVEVNENVNAGTEVATVACGDGIEVRLAIPESTIARFSPGMSAQVRFGALPESEFEGVVTEVGNSADGVGTTFPVTVQLQHPGKGVRAGLAAEVGFRFSEDNRAATRVVPTQALIDDHSGTYVYLAVVENPETPHVATVTRRNVELGGITNEGIEVLNGLDVGDRVITAGVSVIRPQQKVLLP